MLAVFDFDHTIVNENSDIVARNLIHPPNLVPNSKDYPGNWTQYMQEVFDTLKTIEITAEKILKTVSLMSPIQGMPKLMKTLYDNNVDVIVVSDSNSLFIHCWLKENELLEVISCVYTNPAKIEGDAIKIKPYALQTNCELCTNNMCKGTIVEKHISLRTNITYDKTFYFGDGKNDLCPILKLTKNDIAFPRIGYTLNNLLKSHTTQSEVMPWSTGDEIYEFLLSSKLISV